MGSDQAVGRHVVRSCPQPSAHKSGRSRHEKSLCGCLVAACRNGRWSQALIKESGGRVLAAGQNVTSLEGEPPKKRVVMQVWDSMDQIKAWRSSAKFKELQPLREKYRKARAFTIEGLPN
jgi:uncharacterized protein (DUF1330 family)